MSQDNANTPNMIRKPGANPVLALILALFWRLGTIYNGQTSKFAVLWLVEAIGWILCVLPGIFIWALGFIDAYQTAARLNSGEAIPENEYSLPLLFKIAKIFDKTATCSRA
jgi:hypothetical protein